MFEAKVSATCRFHTGSTGSPGQTSAVQCSAVQAQATSAQWCCCCSSQCSCLATNYAKCLKLARAASTWLLPCTLCILAALCLSLSVCLSACLSVPSSRWPGDKFQVLVKQVIKVDLSTMGSFYTRPATDAAAVASTAAAAIVNSATF